MSINSNNKKDKLVWYQSGIVYETLSDNNEFFFVPESINDNLVVLVSGSISNPSGSGTSETVKLTLQKYNQQTVKIAISNGQYLLFENLQLSSVQAVTSPPDLILTAVKTIMSEPYAVGHVAKLSVR